MVVPPHPRLGPQKAPSDWIGGVLAPPQRQKDLTDK